MKRMHLLVTLAVLTSGASLRADMTYLFTQASFSDRPENGPLNLDDTHSGTTSALASVDSGVSGSAAASAAVSGYQLTLRASANVQAVEPTDGLRRATGEVTWTDYLILTPRRPSGGALPSTVRLTLDIDGSLSNDSSATLSVGSPGGTGSGNYVASQERNGAVSGKFYSQLNLPGRDPVVVNSQTGGWPAANAVATPVYGDLIGGDYLLNGQFRYAYPVNVYLDVLAQATDYNGSSYGSDADFSHTAQVVSLTVPDQGGGTPEALGWDVSFASGLPSPNGGGPAPAPAPSAAVLAAAAVLCLVGKQVLFSRQHCWWEARAA